MKQILIFVLLSTIGFSQNCENPILDQVLESNDVNQYFKIAFPIFSFNPNTWNFNNFQI